MGSNKELQDILDLVSNWADYMCFMKRIPSLSLGIIKDGRLVLNESYRNFKSRKPATTTYRIASISKLFTAVAILQLAKKGKLFIEDPVAKHLDWFLESDITIKHLLTHSSGLSRDGDSNCFVDDNFPDKEQVMSFIKRTKPIYPPAQKWKYSNLGFSLLGFIIEKVSGKDYCEYVKENILEKIGLENTETVLTESAKRFLATGYSRDTPNKKRTSFEHVKTDAFAPATGFLSNVEDLSKVLLTVFEDNNALGISSKEMMAVQIKKDQKLSWGLGARITQLKDSVIYGHNGKFQGYNSSIGYSPEYKLGIVVLINAIDGPAIILMESIFNMITHVINNYDSYSSKKKIDLNKYVGRFTSRWREVDIRMINERLVMYTSSSMNPFHDIGTLKHKEKDVFILEKGDGFARIGEKVRFIFEDGKVKKVISGAFEMTSM